MSSVNPTGAEPRPAVDRAADPEEVAAPAVAVAPAEPRADKADLFDGIQKLASSAAGKVSHWFDRLLDRPFAMGRDGFVALDPGGKVIGGRPPSARVRDIHAPKTPLDPLLKILADGDEHDVTFSLPDGRAVTARTDGAGFKELPLDELAKTPLGAGLDPKRGGLVDLQVSTPKGEGDEARVLALPKDYDGPLFVVDVDHTLRDTKTESFTSSKPQPPIAGAKELLEQVAARGVPIVYLSAGIERLRPANEQFLDQLPKGILLDRSRLSVADALPINGVQARRQGLYKAGVMAELEEAFPGAKLFGLGDDKYGDAMAYTQLGATAYIHDVRPGDDNLPADFHGTLTKEYTPDFIAKVGADLQRAIETSASFGGTPVPVDPAKELSRRLDQLTGTRATDGNRIEALVDGVNAFPAVLETIDSAKTTLCYEVYQLISGDRSSEEIASHLIAAHERGVKVRVVIDAVGSLEVLGAKNATIQRLREAGVEVRAYNPVDEVDDVIDFHRDHRKVIVADGTTAMVGGMNTGDRYYGESGPEQLHDVFTRIRGPAVREVAEAFYDSWEHAGGSPIPPEERNAPAPPPVAGGTRTRIVSHVPGEDRDIRAAYLTLFNNAKTRINVENSYPMADDLVDSLVAAAKRGVEVRYIVDPGEGPYAVATRKNYQRLLDAGVHIYMYPGGIHTKAISVDGRFATVGSSNVDNTALDRNREIVAVMEDPADVAKLDAALFDKDVVGDPLGRKTIELPKKLDPPFWDKVWDWVIQFVWPDTYE